MRTFDSKFWKIFIPFLVIVILILYFPYWIRDELFFYEFNDMGQIGDTIGGLTSPFIGIAGAVLTFLAFWVQFKANEQQKNDLKDQKKRDNLERFEDRFFEMINIHRENINQSNYSKYDPESDKISTSENRKVFKTIFQEFKECLYDVRRFSNSINPEDYLHPVYLNKVKNRIKEINPLINIIEFITIDIAYSILFYGVSEEGEIILRSIFQNKYNNNYYFKLIKYIQLKPKRENKKLYEKWEEIHKLNHEERSIILNEIYNYNKGTNPIREISEKSMSFMPQTNYSKYYGGHQHRLSHYFRHLFQSFKYLSSQDILDNTNKYFYGKIFRAQISTYEQAIIFINSITRLGYNWEYMSKYENKNKLSGEKLKRKEEELKFITYYQLIKNLPGTHLIGIKYKDYYPNVKFEIENN